MNYWNGDDREPAVSDDAHLLAWATEELVLVLFTDEENKGCGAGLSVRKFSLVYTVCGRLHFPKMPIYSCTSV